LYITALSKTMLKSAKIWKPTVGFSSPKQTPKRWSVSVIDFCDREAAQRTLYAKH
jgi:hypothetical protein